MPGSGSSGHRALRPDAHPVLAAVALPIIFPTPPERG